MRKLLVLFAVFAVLPVTVFADITVYGRANVSADLLDDGADYSEVNMISNASRLGFKGSKDFDGITGIFQIEQEVNINDVGNTWASRDTFVGIKAGFGMLRAGKFDTPFKVARAPANYFGDQMGDMRNLTRVGDARFDERLPNIVHYQTPVYSGLQFNIAYSLHEGNSANPDNEEGEDSKDKAVSASATFNKGAFDLTAAYESYLEDYSRGERDAFRVVAAYNLDAWGFFGFYQLADHEVNDLLDSDVFGIGASYKVTDKTVVRSQYLLRQADAENLDSAMASIGVEHKLASSLAIYAIYALVNNDDYAALNPWTQGRSADVPGVAGETASGLSVGLRFDF